METVGFTFDAIATGFIISEETGRIVSSIVKNNR